MWINCLAEDKSAVAMVIQTRALSVRVGRVNTPIHHNTLLNLLKMLCVFAVFIPPRCCIAGTTSRRCGERFYQPMFTQKPWQRSSTQS